jgi:molybdopterin molybdotransferase
MTLSLAEARAAVIAEVTRVRAQTPAATEPVALGAAAGRVLAVAVTADRDQPPFPRSTRDGFAVRASDFSGGGNLSAAGDSAGPVRLRVVGEVAAGATWQGEVAPGTTVEIMTGAPVPSGADAVVMVEHIERSGDHVTVGRGANAGDNIVPQGSELGAGQIALPAGTALDAAAIALLASLGCAWPSVFVRPKVAILGTGDELVSLDATPGRAQIRDSNRYCLAALIERAGGQPLPLPIAPDDRGTIEAALAEAAATADIILVSGGVSMGKYDHVEAAMAALSARVVFDGVAIRPGKPLVFALLGGKPLFGLPGNPLSAMVTFQLFGAAALELCGGRSQAAPLAFFGAQLAAAHTQKPVPLTVFLPATFARTATGVPRVNVLRSQGSGDLAAMAAADGLLVIEPGTATLPAGAWATVLPK